MKQLSTVKQNEGQILICPSSPNDLAEILKFLDPCLPAAGRQKHAGMARALLAHALSRAGLMKNQPGMARASLAHALSRAGLMKNQPGMIMKGG